MTISKCTTILAVLAAVLLTAGLAIGLPREVAQDVSPADALFRAGRFDEAVRLYAQSVEKNPSSFGDIMGLARVHLLRNSLAEAESWLRKAIALKSQEAEPQALMGEVLYRRDLYAQAAPFFEAAGRKPKAERLKAFEGKTPFEIESGPEISVLPFLQTDPLPVIQLTINGQDGKFLIDTGGWELHVFPAFAEKSGLKSLGTKETGTYAGGRQAGVSSAVAERVKMGDFSLKNVPIVLPERANSPFNVDGIVGTVVLYHFLFTLDYPGGRLILRRYTPEASQTVETESAAAGAHRLPFWLAGDHFIYAWGTINGAGPYLLFVDTGMGGGGFSCYEFVVEEAKIELPKEGVQGMGGGGPVTVYPITVDLSLGGANRQGVRGFYGALPPGFEDRNGFRSGGLISHGFFRPYAVTFDFRTMTMFMKSAD